MYNIGALYAEGRGVERDLVKCAEWLNKAALLGEVTAQFNLANMYYLGKGVERDLDKAAMWYSLAKEQGHRNAGRFLKHLEDHQDILELDSNFTIRLIPER
jgi:TPR repeat protein